MVKSRHIRNIIYICNHRHSDRATLNIRHAYRHLFKSWSIVRFELLLWCFIEMTDHVLLNIFTRLSNIFFLFCSPCPFVYIISMVWWAKTDDASEYCIKHSACVVCEFCHNSRAHHLTTRRKLNINNNIKEMRGWTDFRNEKKNPCARCWLVQFCFILAFMA